MRQKISALILFIVFIIFTSGCIERVVDLKFISTKNINLSKNYVKIKSKAKGESTATVILIIPVGYRDINAAIKDVLAKNDGDFLRNVKIDSEVFYIPPLFGQISYRVVADVYKDASRISSEESITSTFEAWTGTTESTTATHEIRSRPTTLETGSSTIETETGTTEAEDNTSQSFKDLKAADHIYLVDIEQGQIVAATEIDKQAVVVDTQTGILVAE